MDEALTNHKIFLDAAGLTQKSNGLILMGELHRSIL